MEEETILHWINCGQSNSITCILDELITDKNACDRLNGQLSFLKDRLLSKEKNVWNEYIVKGDVIFSKLKLILKVGHLSIQRL